MYLFTTNLLKPNVSASKSADKECVIIQHTRIYIDICTAAQVHVFIYFVGGVTIYIPWFIY